MKKISIIFLVTMLLLTGCGGTKQGSENSNQTNGADNGTSGEEKQQGQTEGFQFEYNDIAIPMNVDAAPILEKLGESMDYFEAPSCAFQGLDKIFYYSAFELSTYPQGDKDYVSSVNLLDDTVTTKEGIYLGSTLEDVVNAYGEGYTEENGFYTYTLGDSKLTFVIENDAVTAITYSAIVEGMNE